MWIRQTDFLTYQERKTRSKTRPRFQVARVVAHTHIDIDMHIRVYVKFHFHLHLQSYLSNWHIIYVVNYIRSNINVHHLLFAHVRTAATAGPDQPEPSSSPARASRPKRSVLHSCPARVDAASHCRRHWSGAPAERASPAPLPGAPGCSAFKGRNSRLQHACKKNLGVRATASCPHPTRQSLLVVLVLHGAIHRNESWFLSVSSFSPEKQKLSTPFSFLFQGCPVTTFHQIQRKTNTHVDASQWFTNHSQYLLHNLRQKLWEHVRKKNYWWVHYDLNSKP